MPELPSPLSGNAVVCSAVALGWQVADLFHLQSLAGSDPEPGLLLPERSDFSAGTQANWLAGAIATRIQALLPGQFPEQPPTELQKQLTALGAVTTNAPEVPTGAVFNLHGQLLDALGAADFRLGKAYSLGQTLAELALTADRDWASFQQSFTDGRVAKATAWLYDLKALLPDHTAYAVTRSLDALEAWAPSHPAPARGAGQRQGQIWRELLTGEKPATSLLGEADYQAAFGRLVRSVLRRYRWLLVAVLAAAVAAVCIVLAVQSLSTHVKVFGGIGTAVGVLGISLAGTGALAGKALKNADSWLWQAELDQATADAAITLPERPKRTKHKDVGKIRLKLPPEPKASGQNSRSAPQASNGQPDKTGADLGQKV